MRARLYKLVALTPLVAILVSLAMSLVAYAEPCVAQDAGGC